jgi:hypothetical protein
MKEVVAIDRKIGGEGVIVITADISGCYTTGGWPDIAGRIDRLA